MKKLIILIFVLCLLTGCWGVPPPPEPPNGTAYRGFFVGVNKYNNGWTLPSPAKNTDKLEALFKKCKFDSEEEVVFTNINKLKGLEATKENILNGILDTFAGADDNDVSYFYYMGHGGTKNDVPMITPADYNPTTWITVHELEETLSMIPGTKVVFLETCHAGNFIDKSLELEPFDDFSLDLLNKEGYQVLCSSAGSQFTYDSHNGSYFCNALLNGCRDLKADKNEDEIIDISELYEYIKFHVTRQQVQIYPYGSTFPIYEE